jgi:O-antigen/teichoic acid export membrane protein
LSSTKKNYIFNLLLTGFNILFPIISFPYAAKILGPIGIGKVQFMLSFTQYFALVAALGIPIYGSRLISQSTHDAKLLYKNLGELLFIHIFCSVIITALYVGVIMYFSFFESDRSLYFLAGSIVLMGFTSVDWYFSGIENFKMIAIRSVSVKALSLVGLFLFVKVRQDYNIYLIISLFSILGNNIINIYTIRKQISLSYKGAKKHIKPLMYTFGTSVATSMYTMLDTVLIGFFANDKAVGLYSASTKLTKISIPLVTSAATVLIPKISKMFGNKEYGDLKVILNKSFDFIVFLAVPICVGLMLLAPELMYVLSGSQFNEAIITMQILSPLTLVIGLGCFWGFQILIPAGKEKEMLISVTIGMVVNLALNCVLISLYKQNGAAVANIVSEIVVTAAYMYFCVKFLPFKISHKLLFTSIIGTVPAVALIIILKELKLNVYLMLIVSGISFLSIYLIMQIKIFKNNFLNELVSGYLSKRK